MDVERMCTIWMKCCLPLPSHCRIVCIDVRKIRWCSFGSVAFHSFVWPSNARKAKCIMRTPRANHCQWTGILVIRRRCPRARRRCFGTRRRCFKANRVLVDLFWSWAGVGRPWVFYRDGQNDRSALPGWVEFCSGDAAPEWLNDCYFLGV